MQPAIEPLVVPGNLDSLSVIGQYVNRTALEAGLDKKVAYRLRLAVDEIASNVIIHGYEESGQSGDVVVMAKIDEEKLTITLEDSSPFFDPRGRDRPEHIDKPAHERPIGGLGVYLASQNVDRLEYEYVNNHNRNIFIVNRAAAGQ